MKKLAELMEDAIDKMHKPKPINLNEWFRTGEILDVVDCYDHTEIVHSFCGNYIATGVISCDELVDVEDVEFL